MKITIIEGNDCNGSARFELRVDGKYTFSVGCLSECPEDANLERDLSFVYDIEPLMRTAYDAGKRGELLEFEHEREKEE